MCYFNNLRSSFRLIVFFVIFLISSNCITAQNLTENYNPKLSRLNSVENLNLYIDSLIAVEKIPNKSSHEVLLVNKIIEDRFYHGFSNYTLKENFIAFLAGKYIWDHLSAIVIPDDILKHSQAACSQQSIVMMETLKHRGYKVRKLNLANHFILEVFYENDWKVFDPNKEPTLQGFSHDSININLGNGNLNKAYGTMTQQEVYRMYKITKVGPVNEFPAKNARIFHIVTKFVSQYFLVFLTAFILGAWSLIKGVGKSGQEKKKVRNNFQKVSECQQSALAN